MSSVFGSDWWRNAWTGADSTRSRDHPVARPIVLSKGNAHIECRRAGLTDLKRCWIVVDEYNYDIAERSWYIGPDGKTLGRFSKAFMMKIAAAFIEARNEGRRVSRLD